MCKAIECRAIFCSQLAGLTRMWIQGLLSKFLLNGNYLQQISIEQLDAMGYCGVQVRWQ